MFTQGEIEQVMKRARVAGSGIDFDWFKPVVEAAEAIDILGHQVEVVEVGGAAGDGDYMLILIVNGVRFASEPLAFENHWTEDLNEAPVTDQVLHLLAVAVRQIKKIETVRDTWYTAKPVTAL